MNDIISILEIVIPLLIGFLTGIGLLIPLIKKLKDDILKALEDGELTLDEIVIIIEDNIKILVILKKFFKR